MSTVMPVLATVMPVLALTHDARPVMHPVRPVMVRSGLRRRRAYEHKARDDYREGNLLHVGPPG
jgi:hypothetical protein